MEHIRGLLNSYEILEETNKRHSKSLIQFIKSFKGMIKAISEVIDSGVSKEIHDILTIKLTQLEENIAIEINAFSERFVKVLTNIIKIVKPITKTMKERMYVEIDYQKFSQEHSKLKVKTGLTTKEYKRLYEVENRANEAKANLDSIDHCIEIELPLLMSLNEKIANKLGIMVYIFVCEIYHKLWDSVRDIETFFPQPQQQVYALVFYQGVIGDFKAKRQGVEEMINSIGVLNFRQKQIDSFPIERPIVTVGKALYNFGGLKPSDLKFHRGDTIVVLEKRESGWWIGRNGDGMEGEIPFNYFEFT